MGEDRGKEDKEFLRQIYTCSSSFWCPWTPLQMLTPGEVWLCWNPPYLYIPPWKWGPQATTSLLLFFHGASWCVACSAKLVSWEVPLVAGVSPWTLYGLRGCCPWKAVEMNSAALQWHCPAEVSGLGQSLTLWDLASAPCCSPSTLPLGAETSLWLCYWSQGLQWWHRFSDPNAHHIYRPICAKELMQRTFRHLKDNFHSVVL